MMRKGDIARLAAMVVWCALLVAGFAWLLLNWGTALAQTPVNGNVQVIVSGAAENGHVLKATPGYLVNLDVDIVATNGWVMLFDSVTVPADGAVTPRWCRAVVGNGTLGGFNLSFPTSLRFPSAGIAVAFSSTGCFTKTGSPAAFFAQVQ